MDALAVLPRQELDDEHEDGHEQGAPDALPAHHRQGRDVYAAEDVILDGDLCSLDRL